VNSVESNKVFGVLGVIANFGLARVAPASSVKRLVKALDSSNEDTSMAAYMALVKLGRKYSKAVLQSCPKPSAGVIQVLGDMGDASVIPELERFASDSELAAIARESIEALKDIDDGP
jgi:HEAT repeat protein